MPPRPQESDAALVARCRAGEDAAWTALVTRFAPYVHAIVRRGFGLAPDDAEDVFQEAFARLYERLGELRDDGAVRPWLAQTTRRLAVDRLRGATREGAEAPAEGGPDDDVLERLELAMDVRDALARLPGPCGEILDRFFARDESYATIAEALEIPAGTVASRLSRCLARLRQEIEGTEGRNPGLGAS